MARRPGRSRPRYARAVPSIVALDPGRNVGFAVVGEDGRLHRHAVVSVADVASMAWPEDATVVVGSGTGREALLKIVRARGLEPVLVDERGTSEQGRVLWRRAVPARGLARLLPQGLRSPDEPIDDYAAWAIALRFLGLDDPPD